MSIFNLTDKDSSFIGKVQAVDTANIVVKVENEDVLSNIQVNNLVIIQASKTRQTLIGMVNKIIRTYPDKDLEAEDDLTTNSSDIVKINMIDYRKMSLKGRWNLCLRLVLKFTS